jgi:hypothetical protein
MISIWHLVKKDLRRLCVPVALLSLLTVGEIAFYAAIGGLYAAPDFAWLNRLQNGPEQLLRALIEPLLVYFLVGWLVFEDSPVEKDAHWITRPIAGLELFASKLTATCLLFVLLPLALNFIWWAACGFSAPEIAIAGVELVAGNLVLVAIGITCASLTDGFPRYVLWSLVILGILSMGQTLFVAMRGVTSGTGVSRLAVCWIGAAVFGLALSAYQFATRRHRKTLTFALIGTLVLGTASGVWLWRAKDLSTASLAAEGEDYHALRVKVIGPAHYLRKGAQHLAEVTLQIANIPVQANVARITAEGAWIFNGSKAWSSRVEMGSAALTSATVLRIIDAKAQQPAEDEVTVALPFSPQLVRRIAREPAMLRAEVELALFRGRILAEIPIHGADSSNRERRYTVSNLNDGRQKEKRTGTVSFVLTERLIDGLLPKAMARPSITYFALVNRSTGKVFSSDPVRSGPVAITVLNQTRVACRRLTYVVFPKPQDADELVLVVVGFGDGESIKRTIEVEPMPFAVDAASPP